MMRLPGPASIARKAQAGGRRYLRLLLTPPLFGVGWWFLAWLRGFSGLAMLPPRLIVVRSLVR
jgi:hypothetical protein